MTPLQAFRAGSRAWGVQFHLETDAEVLDSMLRTGGAELAETGVDPSAVRARAAAELPALRRLALEVFSRWAALL